MKIYLAGCGEIGARLGETLIENYTIVGLKRTFADFSFPVRLTNLADAHAVGNLPLDADVIIFTVTPSRYDSHGYQYVYDFVLGNVIGWAEKHEKPPLVLLVSSTGVYGQQNGEWVDEISETRPERITSQWIVMGETQLRMRLKNHLILRFSGIYGNGRNRLIEKVRSGDSMQQYPPLWTNRIHENDVVGVLAFFIKQYQLGRALESVYLVSDDMPVSQYDVMAFIAKELGLPAPAIKTASLTDKLNKRCRNDKLKALGYQLQFPSYQSGYRRQALL